MKKIKSPEIKPHLYSQLIYDKGGKSIPREKKKKKYTMGKTASSVDLKVSGKTDSYM